MTEEQHFSEMHEQAVIGAIAEKPDLLGTVQRIVRPIDFYRPVHGEMYRIILGLAERGEDLNQPTIVEALLKSEIVTRNLKPATYLIACREQALTPSADVATMALRIVELAHARNMRDEAHRLYNALKVGNVGAAENAYSAYTALRNEDVQSRDQSSSASRMDYPTKWLPDVIIEQLEARGALPLDAVGAAVLGFGSAAAMSSRLLIEDSRKVVPTLWVPSFGDAGAGKTPAAEIVWAPYRHREELENARYAAEMQAFMALSPKERIGAARPVNGSRLSDDITLEQLARRLAANPIEAAALVSDELTGLLKSIGQYKQGGGGDKARYLALWSGQAWTYERVGDGVNPIFLHVSNPIVPIFGTIQPKFANTLGDASSGMQARWLPHLSDGLTGEVTGRTTDTWAATAKALLTDLPRKRVWTMPAGSEARMVHLKAEQRWKIDQSSVEQTPASTSFLTKGGEHSARIALVLAEIGAASDVAAGRTRYVHTGEIPQWAMEAAVDIVDYCASVWRALPTDVGMALKFADREVNSRDGELDEWLRKREGRCATIRDIQRGRVAGCKTVAEAEALVARHVAIYGDKVKEFRARGSVVIHAGS